MQQQTDCSLPVQIRSPRRGNTPRLAGHSLTDCATSKIQFRYHAVIFDLFGTLVPLPGARAEAANLEHIAGTLNINHKQFLSYWWEYLPAREAGTLGSLSDNLKHACCKLGSVFDVKLIAAAEQIRRNQVQAYLAMIPESEAAVAKVRKMGLLVGLISNGPPETASVWSNTTWVHLVDNPVFSAEVGMLKPDPAIYTYACELLKVAPNRCLYVGDGGNQELMGAIAVGMDAVLVKGSVESGGFYGSQIDDAHNWQGRTIASVAEVPEILEN